MVFITSLNSLFPLDIPTACILYKVSHKKHPKYIQIASRNFIVRQDRENRFIYNNLLTGNFSNIMLPPIPLIQKFITDSIGNSWQRESSFFSVVAPNTDTLY